MKIVAAILLGVCAGLTGCAESPPARPAPMDWLSCYTVTGDAALRGEYPLQNGLRVSEAVRIALKKTGRTGPITIVFVQRGPEGKTRHIIDLDASLQARNIHDDYLIRGGDELVLPTAKPQ